MASRLSTRRITRRFGKVLANDAIDFDLEAGEVHGLLGENGAGKSTFVSIVSGLYQPDDGEVWVDGRRATMRSPRDAIDLGIGIVHQHFALISALTVAENIRLGMVAKPSQWLRRNHHDRTIERFALQHGVTLPVTTRVGDLSLGAQQRVEILRALYWGSRILILDEPTAVLTPSETDQLLRHVRALAGQGQSVIFITHKLDEVKAFCDRVTVLRAGRVVATRDASSVDVGALARLMMGRDVELSHRTGQDLAGEAVLEVRDLNVVDDRGHNAVRNVSFELRSGEILGLAGIDGNGQQELAEALYGLRSPASGSIRVKGRELQSSGVLARHRLHVHDIPPDRRRDGLVLDMTIWENLGLEASATQPGLRMLDVGRMRQRADRLLREYDVRAPDPDTLARHLSGGNQQKLVLARTLSVDPEVLIASQPCRGLDIAATEYVRARLLEVRMDGTAILLISADLDEVMALSDRIAVMFRGSVEGILPAASADRSTIGRLMTGGVPASQG